MPLPANWNTVTVTATYLRPDSSPATAGSVQFTPVRAVGMDATIVLPQPITAALNVSGQITASLPCPNDAAAGFTTLVYQVIERTQYGREAYYIELNNAMTAVNLPDIVTVVPVGEETAWAMSAQASAAAAADSAAAAAASAAAAGGGGAWGGITGTLSAQTDLQTALNAKLDDSQASAYGLTLLDDIDAATARATLGLGTAATSPATAFDAAGAATTAETNAKSYADTLVVGLIDDRGNHDASTNLFPGTGGSGAAGAILKGDLWTVSVAGTLGGSAVEPGDLVRALIDTPGTIASNWAITQNNIGYVAEPAQTAASQAEAEAGTETAIRKFSPLRIFQAINARLTQGTWISGATTKATPVDADSIPLSDSAAAGVLKSLTWANVKATLKAYFDTLYQVILVSGTNIKTINGASVLGAGDLVVTGGGGSPAGTGTEIQYRNGTVFGAMSGTAWDDTNRALTITGATVTTSAPILNLTQTWNDAAVAFTGIKLDITDTASAAASRLIDFRVGDVSTVAVTKNGRVATFGSGNGYGFRIDGTGVQNVVIATNNNSVANVTALGFLATNGSIQAQLSTAGLSLKSTGTMGWSSGGAVGAFDTAIRRVAAGSVEINNGTSGTLRDLILRNVRTEAAVVGDLVAAATAGAGARSFVTDATATTFLSVVAGGGANAVPVVSDGTNWLIG